MLLPPTLDLSVQVRAALCKTFGEMNASFDEDALRDPAIAAGYGRAWMQSLGTMPGQLRRRSSARYVNIRTV